MSFKEIWKELSLSVYWMFAYLEIDINFVKALIILMFCDTIFGIAKAKKLNIKITSKKLFSGILTKISILLFPFLLALVAKNVAPRYDFTPLVDTVLDIMLVSEFLSILSSMIAIKTGREVKNFDLITRLLKAIRNYLVRLGNMLLIKVEEDSTEKKSNDSESTPN